MLNRKKIYLVLWAAVGVFMVKFAFEVVSESFFGHNVAVTTANAQNVDSPSPAKQPQVQAEVNLVQAQEIQPNSEFKVLSESLLQDCKDLPYDNDDELDSSLEIEPVQISNSSDSIIGVNENSDSSLTDNTSNYSSSSSASTAGASAASTSEIGSSGLSGGSTSTGSSSSSNDITADDNHSVINGSETLVVDTEVTPEETSDTQAGGGLAGSRGEDEPIRIWFFNVADDSLESLEMALSSGIPNHADLYVSNRWTAKLLQRERYQEKLKSAINLCRRYDVKSILVRNLWPTAEIAELNSTILFDEDYYLREIQLLRQEGQEYNTDYIGLDTEPYLDSPVKDYFSWYVNYKPTETEKQQLNDIIQDVLSKTEKVDFLYPAGSFRNYSFYNIISSLGENRIAESTYYDNEDYLLISYPYEIFGVYLNTSKIDLSASAEDKPYYTVLSALEHEDRWASKKGVFLYPKEDKDFAIAEALNYYNSIPE